MMQREKEFETAIVNGKRLALRQQRTVFLGYSRIEGDWVVDTNRLNADVAVHPQFCIGLNYVGKHALEAA